jgi:hypothetical protein
MPKKPVSILVFVATLLVGAMLALAAGCSKHASDETIAQDVQSKVAADPVAKDSAVSVTTKDGKVTLRGAVKDAATQKRVEQIAHEEPRATGVDDQTMVQPDTSAATAVEQPKPQPIVIPAGTVLTVRTVQALGSKTSQAGQSFIATLAQPVTVEGITVIPAGATVTGTVVTAKTKGKIKGEGELSLALTSLSTKGQTYKIKTHLISSTVKGKGKRTAATTGGGAIGGALIGGLAGGGKGAGIGLLLGGGAGLVGGALTGNKQIEIPAESALSFTLAAPLTLPPAGE